MNEAILFCGALLFAIAFRVVSEKLGTKKITIKKNEMQVSDLIFRALSVALFLLYMPELFYRESIASQIGLVFDPTVGGSHIPFTPSQTVLIALLRWMTLFTIGVTVTLPFFEKREAKDFAIFIAPVVIVLNCVFFRPTMTVMAYSSSEPISLYHWRSVIHACVIALTGAIVFERVIRFFREGDYKGLGRRFGKLGLYFLLYVFAFMPVYVPQLFFGLVGPKPSGFTVSHRLLLYFTLLFPLGMQIVFGKKDIKERRYFLIMLALSGFFAYFSQYYYPGKTIISSLPLHLCNTAIALMLFAYVFKLNGIFYFTYFVNIMGALCAIILPDVSGAVSRMGNVTYYYNHIYAVILPFMGVSLGVFPRPNMKLMRKAIAFFALYVLFAAVMDAWLNNSASLNNVTVPYGHPSHIDIDYFFLYSDFFIEKSIFSWAYSLKYNYIWQFTLGDTQMTFYYVYILLIFGIAVILMFAFWGIYGVLYKVEDSHRELRRRKILMHLDRVELLKELDGRSVKEPLHPEGAHMIKINHFSKTYAGSTKNAVTDLNLEIYEGEVFGFIGHNGAGKSTTIKSLVGIQTITDGTIEIQGYDIARQPLEAKLNIGYVSDNHAVYEKLTGREYVSYVADLYMVSEEDKKARIEKYATMFGLTDAMDREIKSYSHGMKQKLMVISALIHDPKVWILDEPLTGLDPTSSHQIKECMRMHANAGNIVFFSSHVIEVVEKICDRVAIISGGRLCRVCKPEELVSEGQSLEELYLMYAKQAERADAEEEEKKDVESEALPEAPAEEVAPEAKEEAPAEEVPAEETKAPMEEEEDALKEVAATTGEEDE